MIGSRRGVIYLNFGTNGTHIGILLGIERVVVNTNLIRYKILMFPFM